MLINYVCFDELQPGICGCDDLIVKEKTIKKILFVLIIASFLATVGPVYSSDLEVEAWPEIDLWISMDAIGKDRILILAAFGNEPSYQYEETALGISWDRRMNEYWSWRTGIRYIWKAVDPPDKNETRAVLDLKFYKDLGDGWKFSDRNRLDLRKFDGDSNESFRYRNRVQLDKDFEVFSHKLTGFSSYELYYDSRYNRWGQRHRIITGVSVPLKDWCSVDVFYGYHVETEPKKETGSALGIAVGLYF